MRGIKLLSLLTVVFAIQITFGSRTLSAKVTDDCYPPACYLVVGDTSLSMVWTDDPSATILLYYGVTGALDSTTVCLTVTGGSYEFTGLLPATTYSFWMAKICGTDTSASTAVTNYTTPCSFTTAPFFETFSSDPICWTLDPQFLIVSGYIYTLNTFSLTGSVDTARAITPVIDASGLNHPYLKFSRIQSTNNGKHKQLDIYYREYEEDSWHAIGTYLTPTDSWKTDSLAIPSNSPTLQIGFFSVQHEAQQLTYIRLDDIYVYDGPECPPVSDVALAGFGTDTAYIHWIGNNPAGYQIRYRTASDSDWVDVDNIGNQAIITPLLDQMDYEVQVAAYCDTLIWESCSFTTPALTANLPYFTDFSDTADRAWQLDNGTCHNHWTMGVPDGYPQIPSALFITNSDTAAGYGIDVSYTNVIASKKFNMNSISTVNIDFDVLCGGNGHADFLKVFLAPTSVNYIPSTYNTFATDTCQTYAANFHDYLSLTGYPYYDYKLNLTQDSVLHISLEMPNPDPNGVAQLVFVWHNDHSTTTQTPQYGITNDVQPGAIITNVHVWQNSCDVVPNLQVYDVVGQDATVVWTSPEVSSSFEVQYKPQSAGWEDPSVVTLTTDSTMIVLHGLSGNTNYDVRVRTNCGTSLGSSNWRYTSFNTNCSVVVTDSTPYIETFDATADCWNLNWNPTHGWTLPLSGGSILHNNTNQHSVEDTCYALPPFMDISAVSHPYLKFYHIGAVRVDYRTSALDSWQMLATLTGNATDSLPLPSGTTYIQLAFNPMSTGYCGLDNVKVYNGPSCPPLSNVMVVDVTSASATISWTGYSSGLYIVRYRTLSDTVWTYDYTSDTTFVIQNLQSSSTYAVEVSRDCPEPNWLYAQFSTPLETTFLPYFTDFAPTSDRGWKLNNGEMVNFWTMGAIDTTTYGLFITHDGVTPGYSVNSGVLSVVTAEKLFLTGDADSLIVSFDVKIGGENISDFFKLYVAPESSEFPEASIPTGPQYTTLPPYGQPYHDVNAFNFTPYNSQGTVFGQYTFCLTQGSGFVHIDAVMPNPNSNADSSSKAKVVFVWRTNAYNGTQPGAIITNVFVKNAACTPVTDLAVADLHTTSADIAWNPTNGETAWTVEYKEASASIWTQMLMSGAPACTLTGLTPVTDYDVRVQANCDDGGASTFKTLSFTTPPCEIQCPYAFVLYDSYGDGWNYTAALQVIQNGDTIATLQAVNHHLTQVATYDTVELLLCHGTNISLEWTSGPWEQENGVFLLAPDGSQLFSQTNMTNAASPLYAFTTSCPFIAPVVVTDSADNITQNQAVLHGHIASAGDLPILERGFEWKPLSETDFTAVITAGDSMSFLLGSLSPNTDFVYHAFATTLFGTEYGDNILFSTLEEEILCPTPSDLHATDSSSQSIAIAWTENGDAAQWNILYRINNGAIDSAVSDTPSYLITNLQPNTTYQIQVQSVCDTTTSEWTEVATATTTTGLADYSRYIRIYPNPAGDVINVEWTMSDGQLGGEIEIVDVYGIVVRTVVGANNYSPLQTRIDVSDLAAGVYFVRVGTGQGVVTKAFVKQ